MNYAPACRVRKNVRIPMRDGVRLAADLYVPATDDAARTPLPVVMDYIPYRKDEVPPGLALLLVPARSTATSSPASTSAAPARPRASRTDEYMPQEQLDGYDAIEWLAAQPWCDGHVNMMGISYGGFTSLQVATHQPPHLHGDHPDLLHRRPLHRRLPLPRRPAAACTTTSATTAPS